MRLSSDWNRALPSVNWIWMLPPLPRKALTSIRLPVSNITNTGSMEMFPPLPLPPAAEVVMALRSRSSPWLRARISISPASARRVRTLIRPALRCASRSGQLCGARYVRIAPQAQGVNRHHHRGCVSVAQGRGLDGRDSVHEQRG